MFIQLDNRAVNVNHVSQWTWYRHAPAIEILLQNGERLYLTGEDAILAHNALQRLTEDPQKVVLE